ncbi:MAG: NAD-dependent epimerase/dehydratase family protein [Chlorobi bacterium]|nr:NAD-dependent epimerase/dehydratase family protein [Chlorobiota bacterium]
MKVLVTGGAGFIGSHIAEAYRNAGHHVVAMDTLVAGSRQNVPDGVRLVEMDIRDRTLGDFLAAERFDVVNHHAALISVPESFREPVEYASVNVVGTVNLLRAAIESGVRRFIFASTGVLYAESDRLPYTENHPLAPLDPYGASKLAAEHFIATIAAQHPTLRAIVLRYGNVYGPRQRVYGEGNLVAVCATKLSSGQQPTIFGDGTHTRDYVFVGDVAELNTLLLDAPIAGTFNVGTGVERSVLDVYRTVVEASGAEFAPRFGPSRTEHARIALSPSSLAAALAWTPPTSFEDGIRRTVEWFRTRSTAGNADAACTESRLGSATVAGRAAGLGD